MNKLYACIIIRKLNYIDKICGIQEVLEYNSIYIFSKLFKLN